MIEAPDLSLAALTPLLFVFGAALVGVLVESFAPRHVRQPMQVALALVGTVGALSRPCWLAGRTPEVTAGGALAVDGAGLSPAGHRRRAGRAVDPAVRRAGLDPGRVAFVASAAVPAGSPRDRELLTDDGCRPRSTRWPPSPSAA